MLLDMVAHPMALLVEDRLGARPNFDVKLHHIHVPLGNWSAARRADGYRASAAAIDDPEVLRVAKAGKLKVISAKAAGIETQIGNHTFRGAGITAYLLEVARHIAKHESPRTTKLYNRRQDEISLDD